MKRIVWMGVGALGSTAATLCRSLKAEHVFVDFDTVESKNLLAQAFTKQALGKNKASALAAQFLNFWGVKAEARPVRVTADNVTQLTTGASLVIDCFDNAESRRLLSKDCNMEKRVSVPLLHAALAGSGDFGLVRWDYRFLADEEDKAGGATCEGGEFLPFIGLLSAALASVVQEFIEKGVNRDVMVSKSGIQTTFLGVGVKAGVP